MRVCQLRDEMMRYGRMMVLLPAALLALALPAGLAWAQADAIGQRQAGLKRMAQQLQAVKAVVDGGGDARAAAAPAQEMVSFFQGFPALFPPGSDKGETKALPSVWSDRAGFEGASATMLAAAQKLQAAANAGDAAALSAAFREAGGACGACHRGYRAR